MTEETPQVQAPSPWEEAQDKSFTKWVNAKLKSRGIKIESVADPALCDGTIIAALLQELSGEKIPVGGKKLRIHMMENMNTCLQFIKARGVNLENIGAGDIVDGNKKLRLGFFWTIILRFTITDISAEGMTAKEGLLLWCNRRLSNYNLKVGDFRFSWSDGKAYSALVHSYDPTALNYENSLKKTDVERTQEAFDVAEQKFNIPKILDTDDVCVPTGPEEKSNMAYVAQIFHAFSEKSNKERAARRVNNFASSLRGVWEMSTDYEQRTQKLLQKYKQISTEWQSQKYDGTFKDVKSKREQFTKYKRTCKRDLIAERSALSSLYSNIQTKNSMYGFKQYIPPQGLLVEDVAEKAKVFLTEENQNNQAIRRNTREIKQRVVSQYCNAATKFNEELEKIGQGIHLLSGGLDEQIVTVKKLIVASQNSDNELANIKKMWADCVEAGVETSDEIESDPEELEFDLNDLKSKLESKLHFIENQKATLELSNVSKEQYKLYETTFNMFDKDCSNTLNNYEFDAALAGLGVNLPKQVTEEYFKSADGSLTKEINLKEFIEFMRSLEEDKSSASQVLDAFQSLFDKDFDAEALANLGIDSDFAKILAEKIQSTEDEPKITKFIEATYAK